MKRKAAGKKAINEALATEERKSREGDMKNKVRAWKNPATGKYETPAPWDPNFSPSLVQFVDRSDVTASTRVKKVP